MSSSLMTIGDVADVLNVSTSRVHQLASAGELAYQWTRGGRVFDTDAVQRLAQRRAAEAHTEARYRPRAPRRTGASL